MVPIWLKLNSLHPKMGFVPSLVEIKPLVFVKKILKYPQCIFVISLLSFLGNRRGFSLEQSWIPLTQGCFVPSLVEINPLVIVKKILKYRQCIFVISLLSFLGYGRGLSLEQTWIPLTQGCSVQSLVENTSVVLKKRINMLKNYNQTDGRIDGQSDGRQAIRKAHLSFNLKWARKEAQNSCISSAECSKIPFE